MKKIIFSILILLPLTSFATIWNYISTAPAHKIPTIPSPIGKIQCPAFIQCNFNFTNQGKVQCAATQSTEPWSNTPFWVNIRNLDLDKIVSGIVKIPFSRAIINGYPFYPKIIIKPSHDMTCYYGDAALKPKPNFLFRPYTSTPSSNWEWNAAWCHCTSISKNPKHCTFFMYDASTNPNQI